MKRPIYFWSCLVAVLLTFATPLTLAVAQSAVTLSPESFVEYDAKDQNAAWTGRAPVSRLEFTLNPENLSDSSLTVAVNPDQFSSGNFIRDTNADRTVFEIGQYPEIVFVSEGVQTEANTLADGSSAEITLTGDLTMHGVTQEVETTVTLSRTGNTVTAVGGFEVKLTDYGMRQPELFGVVVEDTVVIRFNVMGNF
jgi:polyisoprenoid-binding protein YceI